MPIATAHQDEHSTSTTSSNAQDIGLEYIEYAFDAYFSTYSQSQFQDGLMDITGAPALAFDDIDDWLTANDYSPIVSMTTNNASIDKFYGVCAYVDNEIIIAFRGTVFFYDKDGTKPWWMLADEDTNEFLPYYTASRTGAFTLDDLTPGCVAATYCSVFCQVNTVFAGIYDAVQASVTAYIDQIVATQTPNKIVFCGHSLGGALAQLAAFDYLNSTSSPLPAYVVAYGAPRVGDSNFTSLFSSQMPNTSYFFANDDDPVPTLYKQGISADWDTWNQYGQYVPGLVEPTGDETVSFSAPPGVTNLSTPSCWWLTSAVYCHPIQYYNEGIAAMDTDEPDWSWSDPVAVASGSDTLKPNGDYAAVSYSDDSGDYLVLAYPSESMLTIAVYDGSSWTFNDSTSQKIGTTQGVQLAVFDGSIYATWIADEDIYIGEIGLDGTLSNTTNTTDTTKEKTDFAPLLVPGNGQLCFIYRATTKGYKALRSFGMTVEYDADSNETEYVYTDAAKLSSGAESQDCPAGCGLYGGGGFMVYRGKAATANIYYATADFQTADDPAQAWSQQSGDGSSKERPGAAVLSVKDANYGVCVYKTHTEGSSTVYFFALDLGTEGTYAVKETKIKKVSSGTKRAMVVVEYDQTIYAFFGDGNNGNKLSYTTLS